MQRSRPPTSPRPSQAQRRPSPRRLPSPTVATARYEPDASAGPVEPPAGNGQVEPSAGPSEPPAGNDDEHGGPEEAGPRRRCRLGRSGRLRLSLRGRRQRPRARRGAHGQPQRPERHGGQLHHLLTAGWRPAADHLGRRERRAGHGVDRAWSPGPVLPGQPEHQRAECRGLLAHERHPDRDEHPVPAGSHDP